MKTAPLNAVLHVVTTKNIFPDVAKYHEGGMCSLPSPSHHCFSRGHLGSFLIVVVVVSGSGFGGGGSTKAQWQSEGRLLERMGGHGYGG